MFLNSNNFSSSGDEIIKSLVYPMGLSNNSKGYLACGFKVKRWLKGLLGANA